MQRSAVLADPLQQATIPRSPDSPMLHWEPGSPHVLLVFCAVRSAWPHADFFSYKTRQQLVAQPYMKLRMVSHLEMFYSRQEGVCRLCADIMPFYIRHNVCLRESWYVQGTLGMKPPQSPGTSVHTQCPHTFNRRRGVT